MEHGEHTNDRREERLAQRVASALATVRTRIEQSCAQVGRRAGDISIVAVTKGFGPETIEAALACGLSDIGENYYQEASAKFARTHWPHGAARRHFIGRVQRNKARRIAALFDVVQSVDGTGVARALASGAQEADKVLDVLIQVNVAADDRSGIAPELVPALALEIEALESLRLRGIMAIGPLDYSKSKSAFDDAAHCFSLLRQQHAGADLLSLGMSGDLKEAIAAGSTMVRLGTALFGPRPE